MNPLIDRIRDYTPGEHGVHLGSCMVQNVVALSRQTLAEAAQPLSEPLKGSEPNVPWCEIAGFQNVQTYGYPGLESEVHWSVVGQDLPGLTQAHTQLRRSLDGGNAR